MRYLKDCWEGKDTPLRAFWILYILGSIILLIIFLPFMWFVPNLTSDPIPAIINYVNLVNAITMPYILFCTIAIWRCAKNAGKNAYGLKTILVITLVMCVLSVISVIPELFK